VLRSGREDARDSPAETGNIDARRSARSGRGDLPNSAVETGQYRRATTSPIDLGGEMYPYGPSDGSKQRKIAVRRENRSILPRFEPAGLIDSPKAPQHRRCDEKNVTFLASATESGTVPGCGPGESPRSSRTSKSPTSPVPTISTARASVKSAATLPPNPGPTNTKPSPRGGRPAPCAPRDHRPTSPPPMQLRTRRPRSSRGADSRDHRPANPHSCRRRPVPHGPKEPASSTLH
jgi:hypothetical protein